MRKKVMASLQAKQLSEREVEEQYGINARTLQGWRTRKKGPPYLKVGGTLVRYNRAEFEAWIASSPVFLRPTAQRSRPGEDERISTAPHPAQKGGQANGRGGRGVKVE
jgi:predicted DNA-binding transcriptional regulator AlpA